MATTAEIEELAQAFVKKVLREFESGGAYIAHGIEVPMDAEGGPYERVDIFGWLQHVPMGTIGRWQAAVTRIAEDAGLINISGTNAAYDEASFLRPMYGAMRPATRRPGEQLPVRPAKRTSCRCPSTSAKRKTPRRK